MEITIKMTPDMKALIAELRSDVEGGIKAGLLNLVEEIEARAVKAAPVRTSNLVNSISSYVTGTTGVVKATAPYAKYVHEGTGLFGPHRQRIRPKTAKALFWPGARHPVKSVKGMKGRPFFTIAIGQVDPQKVFEEGLRNYLSRRRS